MYSASRSTARRWDSRAFISREAEEPPEAILVREDRMDSEARVAEVSGLDWDEDCF